MNAVDTSLDLRAIMLRVAEKVGLAYYGAAGNEKAQIPVDPADYDRVLRAINDGIEMVYRAYPKWTFLDQTIDIPLSVDGTGAECIDSDAGRYRLPWFVAGPPQKDPVWSQTPQTGWGGMARLIDYNQVLAMRAVSTNGQNGTVYTGWPKYVGCTTYQPRNGKRQGWELVVFPNPNQAYTLRCTFRVFAPKMVELGEKHVMGAQHDQTLIDAAAWAFKRDDSKDPTERAMYKAEFDQSLSQSIALDQENEPKTLGQVIDPSVATVVIDGVNRMTYGPVTTYNGVPINP